MPGKGLNWAYVLAALTSACGQPALRAAPGSTADLAELRSSPDPAADLLFSRHETWRGGDSASSVALDADRVLWLFGDSWVGEGPAQNRAGRRLTSNTIGIQRGRDPSTATISFHGEPFFEDGDNDADTWLWPGSAVMLGGRLLVFLVEIERTGPGLLGFVTRGSRALVASDVSGPPEAWEFRRVAAPPRPPGVQMFGAALAENDFLYLFSVVAHGRHDVHLGRVSIHEAYRGVFREASWFNGSTYGSESTSRAVVEGAQAELSVHREVSGELLMVSTRDFLSSDVVVRRAGAIEGPWSKPQHIFAARAALEPGVFIYSAKAHPELGSPLRITYCTNHEDFWTMASRQDLYFPRFLRAAH
jgi:hypothetical protein